MDPLEAALATAFSLGDEGDWEGMAEHLRTELARVGDEPAILCWLGVAETELGLEGVAYERFRQCLAQNPEDPGILTTVGTALARFDDPVAEGALRTAATLAPHDAEVRASYGAYLSREGLTEDALRELEAARTIAPDDPWVLLEYGVALALGGQASGAVDAFAESVRLEPDDGWARALLGLALIEDGERLEESAGELVSASRSRSDDLELQLLGALASAAADDLNRAEELLHAARLLSDDGIGEAAVGETEERIDEGPAAARHMLVDSVAPSAYRQRLMARP